MRTLTRYIDKMFQQTRDLDHCLWCPHKFKPNDVFAVHYMTEHPAGYSLMLHADLDDMRLTIEELQKVVSKDGE